MAFRLLYLRQYSLTQAYPLLPYSDSYFYYLRALDINSGDFLSWKIFISWPLYSYILAFFLKLGHGSLALAYMAQNILGALNCVLVYFIGRLCGSRIAGFAAGLLCVFYGLFVFYDNLLIYTSPAIFLNSLFFLFILLLGKNGSLRLFFWGGLFLGICVSLQGGILVFGFLGLFWALSGATPGLPGRLKMFFSFCAGFLLVAALLTGMNFASDGKPAFFSRNAGFNFYLGNNPESAGSYYLPKHFTPNQESLYREARGEAGLYEGKDPSVFEVCSYWLGKSWSFISKSPCKYGRLLLKKILFTFSPEENICDPEYKIVSGGGGMPGGQMSDLALIMPLALAGLFFAPGSRLKTLLCLAVVGFSLNTVIFFVISKNRIMMVPFLSVFSGLAVCVFWEGLKQKKYFKPAVIALLCALALLFSRHLALRNASASSQEASFRGHFLSGVNFAKDKDYDGALKELNSALNLHPENPRVLFSLAAVYYELGEYEKAERLFKRVLEEAPFYPDAYYNLGYMYNRSGRWDDALDILRQGLRYVPDDPGLYLEMAYAYEKSGDSEMSGKMLIEAQNKVRKWQRREKDFIESRLRGAERAL